jgi:hypothetical protein
LSRAGWFGRCEEQSRKLVKRVKNLSVQSRMLCRVVRQFIEISVEYTASTFTADEYAKKVATKEESIKAKSNA